MQNELYDLTIKHQILLERYKAGLASKNAKGARKLLKLILNEAWALEVESIGELTKRQRDEFIARLNVIQTESHKAITAELSKDLEKFAKSEARFESKALNSVLKVPVVTADDVDAWAKSLNTTITANGEMLDAFVRDWGATKKKQVNSLVRKGFKEGWTNSQMKAALLGTAGNKFKDGIAAARERQAEAVIRTSVQHVSATARSEVMRNNSDIVKSYQWVSTLDSRTTPTCQALDGRVYPVGKGPLPPIHINCRSTFVPVVDGKLGLDFLDDSATRSSVNGYVAADLSYYDWLKKQPIEFQRDAIGPGFAKLLNDGTMTSDEFARRRLNKVFKPLTLKQMQDKSERTLPKNKT